jgi:hypothetical protein
MIERVLLMSFAVVLAMLLVPALLLVVAIGLVLHPLLWVFDEVSGENAWQRQQRHRMESERPPLSDAEFLRSEGIGPTDAPLWLAVRRAIAESVGLPCEAIYPDDKLADLWRMQSLGPDLMDLVFRLERSLAVRIYRERVEQLWTVLRSGQEGDLRQFAAAMVEALHQSLKVEAA